MGELSLVLSLLRTSILIVLGRANEEKLRGHGWLLVWIRKLHLWFVLCLTLFLTILFVVFFFYNTIFNTSFKIFISLLTLEDFFLWVAASLLTHVWITNGVNVNLALQVDKIINFALSRGKVRGLVVCVVEEVSRFQCELEREVPPLGPAGLASWSCCYPGLVERGPNSLSGFKPQLQLCDLAANLLFLSVSRVFFLREKWRWPPHRVFVNK